MRTAIVTAIKEVKLNRYTGGQCEPAIYAKTEGANRYRWFVGFGSDYYPASKAEISDFEEYTDPEQQLQDARENIVGSYVRTSRT